MRSTLVRQRRGLYITTNGGATWVKAHAGLIDALDYDTECNVKMRTVPGQAGYFFFTAGQTSGEDLTNRSNDPMRYGQWNGSTLSLNRVPNVVDSWSVGFGPAASGHTFRRSIVFAA
jgi:hypothetical protein